MMYVVLNAQYIGITIKLSELPGVTEIKYFVKHIACLLRIFLLDFFQNIEFVLVSQRFFHEDTEIYENMDKTLKFQ